MSNRSIKKLCKLVDDMNALSVSAKQMSSSDQVESGLSDEGARLYEEILKECDSLVNAPTDSRAETVPKHKFDTLVQHCRRLDAEIAQARAHVNEITLYQQNAVWFWQHDGQDFLESLSCPIIIQPHHLRELLKCKVPADKALKICQQPQAHPARCGCEE